MRKATRIFSRGWLLLAALPLGGVVLPACHSRALHNGNGTGGGPTAGTGGGGAGGGGAGGMASPCAGASDPRLVVAGQRVLRLTMNEMLNTVRYLMGDDEATALVTDRIIGSGDDGDGVNRQFPPLQDFTITETNYAAQVDRVAEHVASYVLANFASVTGCPNATDACATTYLGKLAPRAYRRQLTFDEQSRFTALYDKLRAPQVVNGYQVTFTVEEASSYAVEALLSSQQMLWRWELGDPAMAATSPGGLPLTDAELATHLSFFLTDQPPDEGLLAEASAGTLRANLAAQVDRLLATQTARDWLRTIVETYLGINRLPLSPVDPNAFPIFTPSLLADMGTEAHKFLDGALWNGRLTDLVLSRTTFLNTSLAESIYAVPAPTGATTTTFAQTTLPADQRAGILTNAAFLTSRGRSDGKYLVVPRGKFIASMLLCVPPLPPPDGIADEVAAAKAVFETQSSQQQVAFRAMLPLCSGCHAQFDAYGLLLEHYDTLGRWRTTDDLGQPPDSHATLPDILGGGVAQNAIDLAATLAASPVFTNCLAKVVLQYALVDFSSVVEVQLPPQQAGCAAADVVQRYQSGGGNTFTDLVRATAAAPAFVLRRAAP